MLLNRFTGWALCCPAPYHRFETVYVCHVKFQRSRSHVKFNKSSRANDFEFCFGSLFSYVHQLFMFCFQCFTYGLKVNLVLLISQNDTPTHARTNARTNALTHARTRTHCNKDQTLTFKWYAPTTWKQPNACNIGLKSTWHSLNHINSSQVTV